MALRYVWTSSGCSAGGERIPTGALLAPRSRALGVLSALLQERTEDTRVAVGPEIVRTGFKDYVPGSIDDQQAGILDDDALTLKFHSDGRPCHACRPIRQVDREVQDARVRE